jgi:hypothetical protein
VLNWLKKHHIIHTWSPWKTTAQGHILVDRVIFGVTVGDRRVTGNFVDQERRCEVCGLKQLRTEKADL